jgi:hypothetical protein
MPVHGLGPSCSKPNCKRPVWDKFSGLCSPCWHLARAVGQVPALSEPDTLDECERIWQASQEANHPSEICSNCGHTIGVRCSECLREFMCGRLGVPCERKGCVELVCPAEYDGSDSEFFQAPEYTESPRTD